MFQWYTLDELKEIISVSTIFYSFLPLNDLVWYNPTNYLSQNPYKWKFFVLGMAFLVWYQKKKKKTLLMYPL